MQFTITKTMLALGLASCAQATTWAQFCNDHSCSENCGESVSTDNPGCLNESGRNSIKFHGGSGTSKNLVISPNFDCPCQSNCLQDIVSCDPDGEGVCSGSSECYDLAGTGYALSFRFVGDGATCDKNNC